MNYFGFSHANLVGRLSHALCVDSISQNQSSRPLTLRACTRARRERSIWPQGTRVSPVCHYFACIFSATETCSPDGGNSGAISIRSGTAHNANSLAADRREGRGGDIEVAVGDGSIGDGGNIRLQAGNVHAPHELKHLNQRHSGGNVSLTSGYSSDGGSGDVHIDTPKSGVQGDSGSLRLGTGKAQRGDSGSIELSTGVSRKRGEGGDSGSIKLAVGRAFDGDGGLVSIASGNSHAKFGKGGDVQIHAGQGRSDDFWNGGSGGNIEMVAGAAFGKNKEKNIGGEVFIAAGGSQHSVGGTTNIRSGLSVRGDSGEVKISSENSSDEGRSGRVSIKTGEASYGTSGEILIMSGDAKKKGERYQHDPNRGFAGNIRVQVGHAEEDDGGNATITGGSSSAVQAKGGTVILTGGAAKDRASDGGDVHMSTLWSEMCCLIFTNLSAQRSTAALSKAAG